MRPIHIRHTRHRARFPLNLGAFWEDERKLLALLVVVSVIVIALSGCAETAEDKTSVADLNECRERCADRGLKPERVEWARYGVHCHCVGSFDSINLANPEFVFDVSGEVAR